MAESANTLFHFTDVKALKNILENGFYPKYREENLSVATPEFSLYRSSYVPMVCFCDLPLSRIKEHIEFYGDYGIGLRKEGWGIERGISPIIYLPDASYSSIHFRNIAIEIGKTLANSAERNAIREQLQNFYKYIKPYQGKVLHRRKKQMVETTFYHEREWRYVPGDFPVISAEKTNHKLIRSENLRLQNKEHNLRFQLKHIKYIVVKEEKEIKHFTKYILKALSPIYKNPNDLNLLISKLISVEYINQDI